MTMATDTGKREAVERWARATGRWNYAIPGAEHPWRLAGYSSDKVTFRRYRPGQGGTSTSDAAERPDTWDAEDDTALLAALCIEGGHTLDVGRCPACEARGCGTGRKLARFEWAQEFASRASACYTPRTMRWPGFATAPHWVDGLVFRVVASRPCPTCNADPEYRHTLEAARLVLDAAPRPWTEAQPAKFDPDADPSETVRDVIVTRPDGVRESWRPGDPEAREHIEVLATRLQQAGEPLGEWLTLWLLGRDGWQAEALAAIDAHWRAATIECDFCDETGIVTEYENSTVLAGPGLLGGERMSCPECHGHGRVAA